MHKRIISLLLIFCVLFPFVATAESSDSSASDVKVGDVIVFGHYEQDNVKSNGSEPIEWRVLDVNDGVAFLISVYALDCKQYNTEYIDITWANCFLRRWLNNQFYKAAFSEDERDAVILSHIDNSLAQSRDDWVRCEGKPTEDYVFLLSYAEGVRYFKDDKDRQCIPTAFALRAGAQDSSGFLVDGQRPCWYWLRTPGHNARNSCVVIDSGILKNQHVNRKHFSVRPCINLDLSKAGY